MEMISSKALSFSEFLAEGWMVSGGSYLPTPENVKGWKLPPWKIAKGNVTPETFALLKRLEPYFSEISLFSWHPNISAAQYSAYYRDNHTGFTSDEPNNMNSRSFLEDKIVVKRSKNFPSEEDTTFSDFRIIERAIKAAGFMETSGGSGSQGKDHDETSMQISFLHINKLRTHEEAKALKEKMITAGAYTFVNGTWKFIPYEEFSIIGYLENEARKEIDFIVEIFEGMGNAKIVYLNSFDSVNPKFNVTIDNSPAYTVNLKRKPDGSFKYEIHGKKWRACKDRKELIEVMGNGLEEVCPRIFPDHLTKKLVENPENHAEILKDFRGKKAGKNTGIV
jgi:hypothetical protein